MRSSLVARFSHDWNVSEDFCFRFWTYDDVLIINFSPAAPICVWKLCFGLRKVDWLLGIISFSHPSREKGLNAERFETFCSSLEKCFLIDRDDSTQVLLCCGSLAFLPSKCDCVIIQIRFNLDFTVSLRTSAIKVNQWTFLFPLYSTIFIRDLSRLQLGGENYVCKWQNRVIYIFRW